MYDCDACANDCDVMGTMYDCDACANECDVMGIIYICDVCANECDVMGFIRVFVFGFFQYFCFISELVIIILVNELGTVFTNVPCLQIAVWVFC